LSSTIHNLFYDYSFDTFSAYRHTRNWKWMDNIFCFLFLFFR
jgi:hypothetical protein